MDAVDRFGADPHARVPWMRKASEFIWKDMRGRVRAGGAGLGFRSIVLNGSPNIGKSAFVGYLARATGLPCRFIDAGHASAAFRIAGIEYGWATGCPGVALEEILRTALTTQ